MTNNNSDRRGVSNTLFRISRELVQSTQVAVTITSFEFLIITIWYSEMLVLLFRIINDKFYSFSFSPKRIVFGGSNQ